MKRENPIPESKIKAVKELGDLIKNKKTILIASIKNIPGSQFQEIVKKLRGKAIVKVPKKKLIFRAIDKELKEEAKKIKEKIGDSFAILFSDLDSFELAGELIKNQSPAKAKVGQESPTDIEIPEGPTELMPGPAISELGALGIKIKIENGKITITEPKVIAKQGEKISQGAADLMSKLDIKPFKIGFLPLGSYDSQEKIFYSEIKIDREGNIEELKNSYGKALAFAVEIAYSSPDTITFLIGKANANYQALEKLKPSEEKIETKEENNEDKKEDSVEEKSSDEKEEKIETKEKSKDQTPVQESKSPMSAKQSDDSSSKENKSGEEK